MYRKINENKHAVLSEKAMMAVRLDSKGRLSVPKAFREKLNVKAGDVCFLTLDKGILHIAKAENPFDRLAEHAVSEYRAGKTKNLRQYAKEQGIDLND